MATLFAQSIIQFALMRTFARMPCAYASPTQLIRELFPKALFDEQCATYTQFFEIAWSFLSMADLGGMKTWSINQTIRHRIGGLPTIIWKGFECEWYKNGECHRDDKDLRTGLTLPAAIHADGSQYWYQDGKLHRDDKDPRTGLTLPAFISIDIISQHCYNDGNWHRVDKDPQNSLTFSVIVGMNGSRCWYKDGKFHRVDKNPITGLTLPAIICTDGKQYWYKDGELYRDDIDPQTGLNLPTEIHANI